MKKLLIAFLIFALCCAMPFIGLWLTKLGYSEFQTNWMFASGIGICMGVGIILSLLYYFNDKIDL